MTTRSSSPRANEAAIPSADPSALPEESSAVRGDPVGALVHAAVADRPVEEVAHLITLLERSPEHARATLEALRAIGVDRSVEDVTQLVALLTRPPRTADSADETIRAAAEHRCLDDVTRLMDLLHRAPLEPHCGQEAARVAATGRPVEELVELIRRLNAERERPPASERGPEPEPEPEALPEVPDNEGRAPRSLGRGTAPAAAPSWPGRIAVAALVVCAIAHFPLHRDGAGLRVYGLTLAMSVACLAVALLLTLRISTPALATAVVVPAALAAAQLFEGRLPSADLSRALDLTLAPTWSAGLTAVCAALAALAALLVHLAAPAQGRRPAVARETAAAVRARD
ncbi:MULTISPECIES: hypothetical protein [unclassified Streptomyces]|uniref:hypothetical protein n=1 Tax=unclassified Streptomyces TaxID=2593676 RepID=UPI00166202E0|nr:MULTISPECIES: hypothetical protein [unclassified Streptomyces]MBD0839526.1 hypothetical protein [Streptomyces sp. TRM68416]